MWRGRSRERAERGGRRWRSCGGWLLELWRLKHRVHAISEMAALNGSKGAVYAAKCITILPRQCMLHK